MLKGRWRVGRTSRLLARPLASPSCAHGDRASVLPPGGARPGLPGRRQLVRSPARAGSLPTSFRSEAGAEANIVQVAPRNLHSTLPFAACLVSRAPGLFCGKLPPAIRQVSFAHAGDLPRGARLHRPRWPPRYIEGLGEAKAARARETGGQIGTGKCYKGTYIPTDKSWARARALLSQRAHNVGQRSTSSTFYPPTIPRGTRVRVERRDKVRVRFGSHTRLDCKSARCDIAVDWGITADHTRARPRGKWRRTTRTEVQSPSPLSSRGERAKEVQGGRPED
eukprot:1812645-Pleurochrysis_carterae.AAC.4